MKTTTKLILGGLLLSGLGIASFLNCDGCSTKTAKYEPRENSLAHSKTPSMHAIDLYEEMRLNVNTGKIEPGDFARAWQQIQNFNYANRSSVLTLVDEGPDNVGGRTRAILVDRNDRNIVYAGSVSGGLFKSTNRGNTWSRVANFTEVLSVSSLAQTPNGTIYVGTGHEEEGGSGDGGSGGHRADGVWYTTDNGATFTKLTPTTNWGNANINAIVADPNVPDKIYVGGSNPVFTTVVENKTNFTQLILNNNVPTSDLQISKDGNVIVAGIGNRTYVKVGTNNFTRVSGSGAGQVKETVSGGSLTRIEYTISHDKNPNGKYSIYASMVKLGGSIRGMLGGVSASHDNGETWAEVVPETPNNTPSTLVLTSDPFANGLQYQGDYDNIITTVPGNPKQFLLGGINVFRWTESSTAAPFGQMAQVSSTQVAQTSSFYVHADQHEMVWDNTNRLYLGNDGGVGISDNAMSTNIQYYPANRGYNVTQFYGIAYSKYGDLIGGTQDNGTQYKDVNNPGTSPLEFRRVLGGDGFDSELSHLDENVLFSSLYFGENYRSLNKGNTSSTFTSDEIDALPNSVKPFFNVTTYYENKNDVNSKDSIIFLATENKSAGQTIMVPSTNLNILFPHVLTQNISVVIDTAIDATGDTSYSYQSRDTIKIQDKVQTLFALGLNGTGGVWVTRGALRFGAKPVWWKVMDFTSGRVTDMEFSQDGNILYVGQFGGRVTRIKGFNNVYLEDLKGDVINGIPNHDLEAYNYADIRSGVSQLEITTIFTGNWVSGIGVDPKNPENVVVTTGGYGQSSNIYRSTTAASTTGSSSFSSIKGNMITMPVFDAIIDFQNPNTIVAGTEFGAWITTNGGATWSPQNDEMGAVPVYDVQQQHRPWSECFNSGMIYFGTHGRGIWSSADLLSTREIEKEKVAEVQVINLYPNPATNFTNVSFDLATTSDVTISVYSMNGKLISSNTLNNKAQGEMTYRVNTENLSKGVYFVNVQAKGMKFKTAKFIKQ